MKRICYEDYHDEASGREGDRNASAEHPFSRNFSTRRSNCGLVVVGRPRIDLVVLIVLVANGATGHAAAMAGLQVGRIEPQLKPVHLTADDAARLRQAVDATCHHAKGNGPIMIAIELPAFNAVSATFYSKKERDRRGFQCSYASLLNPMETEMEGALRRLANTDCIITMGHPQFLNERQKVFNRFALAIAHHLEASPEFIRIPYLEYDLVIYQKRNVTAISAAPQSRHGTRSSIARAGHR